MKRTYRTLVKGLIFIAVLIVPPLIFVPVSRWIVGIYVLCGLYDVLRNSKRDFSVIVQYFFGNGLFTWLLSPFNVLLDILCLPFINKGIYQVTDFPPAYQAEIKKLVDTAYETKLVEKLEPFTGGQPRSMIFFKWYGKNQEAVVDVPQYHDAYKYIQTIGVSVFNKKESTSRHFGPFRATLRVLCVFNEMEDRGAYIEVGKTVNVWQDKNLFIFDDTLLHQSFNEGGKPRYSLFVDIVRPSLLPFVLKGVVQGVRIISQRFNGVFYKNWKVVGKAKA